MKVVKYVLKTAVAAVRFSATRFYFLYEKYENTPLDRGLRYKRNWS